MALYPLEVMANTLVLPAQLLDDGDMEAADMSAWTVVLAGDFTKEPGAPGGTGSQVLRIEHNGAAANHVSRA